MTLTGKNKKIHAKYMQLYDGTIRRILDQLSQTSQSSNNEFLLQCQNSNLMQHKSGKGADFSLAAATQ